MQHSVRSSCTGCRIQPHSCRYAAWPLELTFVKKWIKNKKNELTVLFKVSDIRCSSWQALKSEMSGGHKVEIHPFTAGHLSSGLNQHDMIGHEPATCLAAETKWRLSVRQRKVLSNGTFHRDRAFSQQTGGFCMRQDVMFSIFQQLFNFFCLLFEPAWKLRFGEMW